MGGGGGVTRGRIEEAQGRCGAARAPLATHTAARARTHTRTLARCNTAGRVHTGAAGVRARCSAHALRGARSASRCARVRDISADFERPRQRRCARACTWVCICVVEHRNSTVLLWRRVLCHRVWAAEKTRCAVWIFRDSVW